MSDAEVDPTSVEWEPLRALFGGYFHQDYKEIHGGAWGAVRAFRHDGGAEAAAETARAARSLAAELNDDEEAFLVTDELGLDYHPPGDGYSYREWLLALADFLEMDASESA